MFKNHVGNDPIDQLNFTDQGFTVFEDTDMQQTNLKKKWLQLRGHVREYLSHTKFTEKPNLTR